MPLSTRTLLIEVAEESLAEVQSVIRSALARHGFAVERRFYTLHVREDRRRLALTDHPCADCHYVTVRAVPPEPELTTR